MSDRPLLVLHDEEEGHLVYDLLLFLNGEDGEETLACFPRPVARFPLPSWSCSLAVSGGRIVCVDYHWKNACFHDAVMRVGGYDFWEKQPSPRMRDAEGRLVQWMPMGRLPFNTPRNLGGHKDAPAMLPVAGDGGTVNVIRMDTVIFDGAYTFETLRLLPDGGGCHATPLPKPPIGNLAEDEVCFISAYVAVGARVWISMTRKGTFSLDTAAANGGTWRMEGAWLLPFEGRALHVPELESVIGLTVGTGLLCACDVKTGGALPMMRHVWKETSPWPWEECISDGHHPASRPRDVPSLAYLGRGRFCICRPMSTIEPRPFGPHITYNASSFLVGEVKRLPNGELQLARRGKTSYMWPPRGRQCTYVGFIQPAT